MLPLPEAFLNRMKERLGENFPAFLSSYERPPFKGLRVNTLKISPKEFLRRAPFPLGEAFSEEGFFLREERPGADPYHFAGLYYLQEPSAMSVGERLAACKKTRVLDLCAAPGGKTTQLAAQMRGEGILIANEIDYKRAKILSENVERMGISNCAVTCASPERLAERFGSYFDLILADAPCSGEGMFKKEPNAIPEWSKENVLRCAERQRGILDEAAKMLSVGGRLVYSTCTFAEEEDEWQIEDFLKRHPEFRLEMQKKLYPHEFRGEGHYCALLVREEGGSYEAKRYPVIKNHAAEHAFDHFSREFFQPSRRQRGRLHTLGDGRMYCVPEEMPDIAGVRLLRLGVELGSFDGKLFKPAHALAMACKAEDVTAFVSLSREDSVRYLRGETLSSEGINGWCVVGVEEFPLGLGKGTGGIVKNHYPKGLRLRT